MSSFITLRKVALASLVVMSAMIAASQAQAGHGFGGFNNGFGGGSHNGFGGGFNHGSGGKGFGGGFNHGFGGKGFGGGHKPGFGGSHFGYPSHKFHGNFGIVPHKNHFHIVPGHFHH